MVKAGVQALAHGVFQDALTAATGGSFWTGFASGALSSIAASAWSADFNGADNPGIGWAHGLRESGAGMIAFGTVAGGAGAELTGGNFWVGAATGLVVSGLNHAMHEMEGRRTFKSRFHNVNPDAKPDFNMASVNALFEDVDGLAQFYNNPDVGSPEVVLKDNDGYAGHYDKDSHQLQLTKNAFSNNYHLARTIFHESYHSFQYHWNGGYEYKSILSQYGSEFSADTRTGVETASFAEFERRAYLFVQRLGDTSASTAAEIYKRSH